MPRAAFGTPGPFVEALLLGNLAVRLGKNASSGMPKTMRSPNCPEADNYITKFYRVGLHDLVVVTFLESIPKNC